MPAMCHAVHNYLSDPHTPPPPTHIHTISIFNFTGAEFLACFENVKCDSQNKRCW